jgi:hypothetical protein
MLVIKNRHISLKTVQLIVLAVGIGVIGTAGLVFQHNRVKPSHVTVNLDTATVTPQTTTSAETNNTALPVDALPVYSNTAYGFSYSYPASWIPSSDVNNDPKTSATRQEFGTGLGFKASAKNSGTVEVEILDESLQAAADWYDQYYAQTPIKVNKTETPLKDRQSVQYDFVAPTYESKQYLLEVGSKTYVFSSVNESTNVSTSPSYWSDFDNTFTSLTIQGK